MIDKSSNEPNGGNPPLGLACLNRQVTGYSVEDERFFSGLRIFYVPEVICFE
jgi:hypothetical protein